MADNYRNNSEISEEEKNFAKKIFPRSFLEKESFDFSFSGLKSAVKRFIDADFPQTQKDFEKISFAFEEAVFEVLEKKFFDAAEKFGVKSVILAGGVSANSHLKNILENSAKTKNLQFFAPTKIVYSQDNAAMIGIRAYHEIRKTDFENMKKENFKK